MDQAQRPAQQEPSQAAPAGSVDWGLSPEERRAWADEGCFIRSRVFSAEEIEGLRAAAEQVVALASAAPAGEADYFIDGNRYREAAPRTTVQYEHRPGSETIRVLEPFHHLHPAFGALVDDARIVDPMRGLVGSERLALFTDKLNLKRPREGSGFRWHQDSPYWLHACSHVDRLPNVMLALDDASEDNGCLRIVRGSHRRGPLPGRQGEGVLGPLFTDPRCFDASRQMPAVMEAGSLLFFSPHSVHGSEPNRSGDPRRALVLTYQPGGHPMFKGGGVREVGAARRAPDSVASRRGLQSSRSEASRNAERSSS